MNDFSVKMLLAVTLLAGIIYGCEKTTDDPQDQHVQTAIEKSESNAISQVAWSESGELLQVDVYYKFEGWDPETSGGRWASCWTGAMDCTCPNGMCFSAGVQQKTTMQDDPSLDPTSIHEVGIEAASGLVMFDFLVDPSVHEPSIMPQDFVPITNDFFVDPAVASALGYTSIEILAGNYVTDYSVNPNGRIVVNAITTP